MVSKYDIVKSKKGKGGKMKEKERRRLDEGERKISENVGGQWLDKCSECRRKSE